MDLGPVCPPTPLLNTTSHTAAWPGCTNLIGHRHFEIVSEGRILCRVVVVTTLVRARQLICLPVISREWASIRLVVSLSTPAATDQGTALHCSTRTRGDVEPWRSLGTAALLFLYLQLLDSESFQPPQQGYIVLPMSPQRGRLLHDRLFRWTWWPGWWVKSRGG